MVKYIVGIFLFFFSFFSLSTSYGLSQLYEQLNAGKAPKTGFPKLIESSIGNTSFEQCRAQYIKKLDQYILYPQRLDQDSLGIFRASLWLEGGRYQYSCITAWQQVIAEIYESPYI